MVRDNALCDPESKKFVFLKLFISYLILFRPTQLVPILIKWQFLRMVITTSIPPISLIQEINTLLISTTSINIVYWAWITRIAFLWLDIIAFLDSHLFPSLCFQNFHMYDKVYLATYHMVILKRIQLLPHLHFVSKE